MIKSIKVPEFVVQDNLVTSTIRDFYFLECRAPSFQRVFIPRRFKIHVIIWPSPHLPQLSLVSFVNYTNVLPTLFLTMASRLVSASIARLPRQLLAGKKKNPPKKKI